MCCHALFTFLASSAIGDGLTVEMKALAGGLDVVVGVTVDCSASLTSEPR
jgi:hypothetical protein